MSGQSRNELDTIAIDIEFLLISIIQGLALQFLVASAVGPIQDIQYESWPYIASAFLLLLIFWSQGIIHALSFIKWPIDLMHTFLYFLASFLEVLTFYQIANPLRWYLFSTVFLIAGSFMYTYDFLMIEKSRSLFMKTASLKKLYRHMHGQQKKELRFFVPLALIGNAGAAGAIYLYPDLFIAGKMHVVIACFQLASSVLLLIITVKNFRRRSVLLSEK